MLKKCIILILVFLILVSLVSCKQKLKSDTNAAIPKGKLRIALVMKTLTNPFFVTMEEGARKAEQELGIELIVKTGAQETSIEQQIAIVEQLISDKVDAIVIAPAGSAELIPVLKRAQDMGIVVVNIDNKLDDAAMEREGLINVPFISVDNFKGAYLSAQYVAKQVKQPTQAILLEGIMTAKNAQDRKNGALKAFAENELIKVVATKTAYWKIDEAFDVTASLFKTYPKVKLIFCSNDMMAMGAVQFLKEKKIKDVMIAGFDDLNEVKPLLADGSLAVTINQQADIQGYMGIVIANKILHKEKVELITTIPVKVITK